MPYLCSGIPDWDCKVSDGYEGCKIHYSALHADSQSETMFSYEAPDYEINMKYHSRFSQPPFPSGGSSAQQP